MTQAYIEGFCKAAEAYGVNPGELAKVAKMLGGPDPAPGMLGASRSAPKEGFLERLVNIMPTGAISFNPGKGGFHMITHGDMKRLTEGMSPLQKFTAYLNPMALNFRKAAEARGVGSGELMKFAKKDDTKKNVAIGAGAGLAAGSAYPMIKLPFDLKAVSRQADSIFSQMNPAARRMTAGALDATVDSIKKMYIKGRIKQALMFGIPLSAVGGIAGYLKNKMN